MKIMTMDLYYMNNTYAVIFITNDEMYNEHECDLVLCETKKEYEETIKSLNEEQQYTGAVWKTLYKKAQSKNS